MLAYVVLAVVLTSFDYETTHLALADAAGERIDVRFSTPRTEQAHDDHVGHYTLMVVELTAPEAALPITLHYDAIMHEVRSHRAAVYRNRPTLAAF